MIAEAIGRIVELGRKAAAIEFLEVPKLEQVIVREGDEFERMPLPPPRRKARLVGLQDIIAAVEDPKVAPAPEIYYDREGIVVLLDREDRRSTASVPFQRTEKFLKLCAIGQALGVRLSPKDAIRLFRFELNAEGSQRLIDALRKVDFQRTGIGTSSVQHGRESLGKAVEAIVQQADDIPETIDLRLPIYSNPGFGFEAVVRIGVYLDVLGQAIEIRPLADEIENAIRTAQAQIAQALNEALDDLKPKPLILHGQP